MNVREYICSLLKGIDIPEAYLVDTGLDLEQEYSPDMKIGSAVVNLVGGIINMVAVQSVSENGFSMSWDTSRLGKLYAWLCKKYGIQPDPDVLSLVGVSAIIDITDTW